MKTMQAEFRFEIGDIVSLATHMEAVKATHEGQIPNPQFPLQVMERRLQECHGGVNQVHYQLVGQAALLPELALVPYSDYVDAIQKVRDALRESLKDDK